MSRVIIYNVYLMASFSSNSFTSFSGFWFDSLEASVPLDVPFDIPSVFPFWSIGPSFWVVSRLQGSSFGFLTKLPSCMEGSICGAGSWSLELCLLAAAPLCWACLCLLAAACAWACLCAMFRDALSSTKGSNNKIWISANNF